jgi:hypothetical protein
MAHPYHHALSSVKKWGGTVEDYQRIHDWFDESKQITADFRHRALRHHAEGIFMAETIFGKTITLSRPGYPGQMDRRAACPRGPRFYPVFCRLGKSHTAGALDGQGAED